MRTLIWKELRENIKWALLAAFALGAAEIYALSQTRYSEPDYYYNDGVTLCKTTFLTVTTFGYAIVGFLLGLIQILPELKRDRWAALLHRPVSRGVILRGKVAAGLILYGVATVSPFLFIVWRVATPGNFSAPFVPEMVLPGTADICVGAAYYFAALALAIQRGGWIGLRVFPLLAAVDASYFVLNNKYFYVSVEAAVLMALALFTAAWGAVYSQELLRERPWLGKLAFLAVIFYGVCGLGNLAKSFTEAVGTNPHSTFQRYELSDQGVPIHLTYIDNVVISVQDFEGKPLTGADYKPDRIRNHIVDLNTFSSYIGDSHGWKPWVYQPSYRASNCYLWAENPYMYPRQEQWFNLLRKRIMIGYLPDLRVPFAILDRRGFEPVSAAAQSFPPDVQLDITQDSVCIWDPTKARIAFLSRRESVDLPPPVPGPIYGMENAWASTGNVSVNVMGLALSTALAVYDDKAALIATLPYHQNMDRWGQLDLGLNGTADRFYLWYHPSEWIDDETKKTMVSYLEVMNTQGQLLHTYTLTPLVDPPAPRWWDTFLGERLQSPVFFFGTMIYQKIGAELGSTHLKNDLAWQLVKRRNFTLEISAYIVTLSLLLAGTTLFWARRMYFSWRRAWAWAAFVLSFNLAGFITFRLAADWPRLVPCPSCAKSRPVEMEKCPHCGSGWPVPQKSGAEIIDGPATELALATASAGAQEETR
jgi:hypothetical protein